MGVIVFDFLLIILYYLIIINEFIIAHIMSISIN